MIPRRPHKTVLGVWLFCSVCQRSICVGNGYTAGSWDKGIIYGILLRIGWKIRPKLICDDCLRGLVRDRGDEYEKVTA